jgi:hypothetical protein
MPTAAVDGGDSLRCEVPGDGARRCSPPASASAASPGRRSPGIPEDLSVITLDEPGHRVSEKPSGPYELDDLADDAHRFARSIDNAQQVPGATLPVLPHDGHGLTVGHVDDTKAATTAHLR